MNPSKCPQERFRANLPAKPYWGTGKCMNTIGPKENILQLANYIQLAQNKRHYVSVDVDNEFGGIYWSELNLPQPSIIIINGNNGHAHLHWELRTPVIMPIANGEGWVKYKPIRFYRDVTSGLVALLDADSGYTGFSTKNPFSPKWKTIWSDCIYTLGDLAEFAGSCPRPKYFLQGDEVYAGRQHELFTIGRKWSYRNVKSYSEFDNFSAAVFDFCQKHNQTVIPGKWDKASLPTSEVRSTARSIAKWTWARRYDPRLRQHMKALGAMGFGAMDKEADRGSDSLKYHCEEYVRKVMGGFFTHIKRKTKTEERIIYARNELARLNEKPTYKRLSEISSLSISTLKRYKQIIRQP